LPEDGDGESSGFRKSWEWYMEELERRPLVTKMWSSGIILALGDYLAQKIEQHKNKSKDSIDPKRLAVYAIFGALISAPLLHIMYELLDHKLPMPHGNLFSHPPGWKRKVAGHLLFDQTVIEVLWLMSFFAGTKLLEGHTVQDMVQSIRRDFPPALVDAWKIWPALQLFNFSLVPVNLRVLMVSFIDVGWTAYLSIFSHGSKH